MEICLLLIVTLYIIEVWISAKWKRKYEDLRMRLNKRAEQHEKLSRGMRDGFVVLQLMLATGHSRVECERYAEQMLHEKILFGSTFWIPDYIDARSTYVVVPRLEYDEILGILYFDFAEQDV